MRLPQSTIPAKKIAKTFALALLLVEGRAIAAADTYTGKAIYITDGDTLSVLVDDAESKTAYKIRLRHIDAPERGQPWGEKSHGNPEKAD